MQETKSRIKPECLTAGKNPLKTEIALLTDEPPLSYASDDHIH